ncbi:MAG: SDR family oxidoreductase [Calditrichota bacterium]
MRILITGASGFLGSHVAVKLSADHEVLGIVHRTRGHFPFRTESADLTDDVVVARILSVFNPEIIIHSAAMSRVIECEKNSERAFEVNVNATIRLIRWAEKLHAKLIFISSDQVYSGMRGGYRESDKTGPIGVYGRTKLEAESAVLSSTARHFVVRSNSIVGLSVGWGESFSMRLLNDLRQGHSVRLFEDQYRSPIHIRMLVKIIIAGCYTDINGLLNAGGPERRSRLDVGYSLLRAYSLPADLIEPVSYQSHPEAGLMTRDTSYDISLLRQRLPELDFRSLDDEFIEDASHAAIRS